MQYPRVKLIFRFLATYFLSFILLGIFFIGHLYLTMPDTRVWNTKNPGEKTILKIQSKMHERNSGSKSLRYEWTPISRIPKLMRNTVIVAEDASFWVHNGIDWYELWESIKRNIAEREFSRGASTITQQLCKNLYLTPEKSIGRKLKEGFIAWEMEKNLPKIRILELYLNVVEWGPNMFGINAAARYYFYKNTGALTLDEMVRLAAVLPNPIRMRPDRVDHSVYWRSKVIVKRLYKFKFIDMKAFQHILRKLESLYRSKGKPTPSKKKTSHPLQI